MVVVVFCLVCPLSFYPKINVLPEQDHHSFCSVYHDALKHSMGPPPIGLNWAIFVPAKSLASVRISKLVNKMLVAMNMVITMTVQYE